jgi:hypothetical protein
MYNSFTEQDTQDNVGHAVRKQDSREGIRESDTNESKGSSMNKIDLKEEQKHLGTYKKNT